MIASATEQKVPERPVELSPEMQIEIVEPIELTIPSDCYIWGFDGDRKTEYKKWLNVPGVVKWLRDVYTIATIAETDEILIYSDGIYFRLGEQIICKLLYLAFGSELNSRKKPVLNQNLVREILAAVRAGNYIRIDAFNTGLDPITGEPLLNLKNGVLNLTTRKLLPHSPDYLFLNKSPVAYDPTATCPTFIEWRNEVLNPEYHPVIEEIAGSILWPDYRIQKAFMFYGPKRTGKGTMIRVLEALIGSDNCSHVSLQELANNKFKVANLFGKKINTFGDLPETCVVDVGYFKALTGEDTVEGEEKFKKAFNFKNTAKLVFSANVLPKLRVDDDAYYNRWVIIPFENSFFGKEDASLTTDLTTPKELSGILNLALDGLERLIENGWKFSYMLDAGKLYRQASNPVMSFLEDGYEPSDTHSIAKSDLFFEYKMYCKEHNLKPPTSMIAFSKEMMANTLIPVDTKKTDIRNPKAKNERIQKEFWVGIKRKGWDDF